MAPSEPDPILPSPRRLARALLRWAWGRDADAMAGDLAESLADRRRRGASAWTVWVRGWWEVGAAVFHAVGGPRPRRGGGGVRPGVALRLGLRGLRRDAGTSAAAAGILALGLASAATFFAILHGLTRPLPVPEGNRVVRIDVVQPTRDGRALPVTGADLQAWADVPALAGVGGVRTFPAVLRDPGVVVVRVGAAALTPEALALLEVDPVAGRVPAGPDAEGVVLVDAGAVPVFWGDSVAPADVLGRVVEVDGRAGTLAAVLPEGFGFPFGQGVWVVERPADHPDAPYDAVARLGDGVAREAAAAQLQARWGGRDGARDADLTGGVVTVKGFTEDRGEGGEMVLFLGLVLVGVALLVIACANVANLLLVRATERVRILAVQAALGAGRAQLALQLLLESLVLAAVGGAVGLLLAAGLAGWVEATMGPENFGYYWIRVAVDLPVVAFTGGLVLGAALLAGLVPVVRVWRTDVHGVLKADGGGAPGSRGRWGGVFVAGQLALSCAALVAAGLTTRSMAAARDFGRDLPGEEVVLAWVDLDADTPEARRGALAEVRDAVRVVDGARVATVAAGAPGYREVSGRVELDDVATDPDAPLDFTLANGVDAAYFALFDLELRQGRLLDGGDDSGSDPVAVVNDAFVARFWPTGSPLGRRVHMPAVDSTAWFRVVGVVETAELGDGPRMREDRVYLPLARLDPPTVHVLARAADGDGAALAGAVRRALATGAPDRPVADVRTLASGHAFMTRAQGTFSTLAAAGGGAGLLVAVVGLYALLAFRVRQRRRELGVRKALGADGPRLIREVLWVALRQIGPAVVAGLALAWLAAPLLGAILLGGDPRSPLVFAGVALVFTASGLAAALAPALRAGRVEPASVLRSE